MKFDRNVALVVIALAAAGLYASTLPPARPSRHRPVMTFMARAAKACLWFMMVESKPEESQNIYAVNHDDQMRHIDQDGQIVLNNGAGW